jgi:hypothetical protein
MEIRKADSKGRVSVGEDGQAYSVSRHEDGTLVLTPVVIPEPPKMEPRALHALYWDVSVGGDQPDWIFVNSPLPGESIRESADFVAGIANSLNIPVVVKGGGLGSLASDYLASETRVTCDVIQVR